MLALRYVLPALFASVVATAVSWVALPNAPTYLIPPYPSSTSSVVWALLAGPIAGVVSVGYVRGVTWADRNKPEGWRRLAAPVLVLGCLAPYLSRSRNCLATAEISRNSPSPTRWRHLCC